MRQRVGVAALVAVLAVGAVAANQRDRLADALPGGSPPPAAPATGDAPAAVSTPAARTTLAGYRRRMAAICAVERRDRAGFVRPVDRMEGGRLVVQMTRVLPTWSQRVAAVPAPPDLQTVHGVLVAAYQRQAAATATFKAAIDANHGGTAATRGTWLAEMARDHAVVSAAYQVLGIPECTAIFGRTPPSAAPAAPGGA